jgi:hypothetical protein
MRRPTASPATRLFCACVSLLTGFLAVRIAWTGEFHGKGGVVPLDPVTTALIVGPLALMALIALWVAVSGRGG